MRNNNTAPVNRIVLFLSIALLCSIVSTAKADNEWKPRLVVCTDIAPADVEPDDMESMVRLMAYADLFEIEAIITTVGWNCDPYPAEWAAYLQRVLNAYGKDVKKLMKRSTQKGFLPKEQEDGRQRLGYWPSFGYLKSRAVMGSQHGGIKAIGPDNDTPGSNLLIRLADEADDRPIYVAAWGGANTLAQAIWRVKQTRTAAEVKQFVRKFRIYTSTDQDMQYSMRMNRAYSSHQWLRQEFADDLQFVWDEGTWQEQCELGKQHWQQHASHIQGKGALGKEYPNYKWGVEGDTPSFLYVMPNGLNNPDDPRQRAGQAIMSVGDAPTRSPRPGPAGKSRCALPASATSGGSIPMNWAISSLAWSGPTKARATTIPLSSSMPTPSGPRQEPPSSWMPRRAATPTAKRSTSCGGNSQR